MYYAPTHNVVIGGNTQGATAVIQSGTMTLAGGSNITLSQAGNALTIIGGGGGAALTYSLWENIGPAMIGSASTAAMMDVNSVAQASMTFFPAAPLAPGWAMPSAMTVSTVFIDVSCSATGTSTTAASYTAIYALYVLASSISPGDQLKLVAIGTATASAPGSNMSTSFNGARWWTIAASAMTQTTNLALSSTATGLSFAAGSVYFAGLAFSSNGAGASIPMSALGGHLGSTGTRSGFVGSTIETSGRWYPFQGVLPGAGLLSPTSPPVTIGSGDLVYTAAGANFVPHIAMNNYTTRY